MVAASDIALQHVDHHSDGLGARLSGPRPLPLFLDLIRQAASTDPDLAHRALRGARAYASANRPQVDPADTIIAHGRITLHCRGTSGPIVLLVPSLINPHWVLDLDQERSLAAYLARRGYRAMVVDWGVPTAADHDLDLAGHVEQRLLPVLDMLHEPVHLVGYCLGGVLSMAAAQCAAVRSLTLLAAPWHFSRYPTEARTAIAGLWARTQDQAAGWGMLPIEVLQTAFWTIDPAQTVAKFAAIADCLPDDARLVRFARLEDWANGGAPMPYAAAADLFERCIAADQTGSGAWQVAGQRIDPARLRCPTIQFTAAHDKIAPAASAATAIVAQSCASGHVGMVIGSGAQRQCWSPMATWFDAH